MFFRLLLGTLRWIIGFAPVFLLAYWGLAFLSNCFLTLLSPSVPLELSYVSPSGTMTLRAETFNVNLKQPTLVAERLTLHGPKGELVAGASLVRIMPAQKNVDSVANIASESVPLNVHVEKPYAKLTRGPNGTVALEEFLPKSQGEPSKRGYSVSILGGVADIVDRYGPQEWRTRVLIPRAHVAGVGKLWTAEGAADVSGIGHGAILAQGEQGQAVVSLQGVNLHLTDLFHHLAETDLKDDLRNVGLSEAIGKSVALSVLIRPKEPLRLSGQADLGLAGLRVSDYVSGGQADGKLAFVGQSATGEAKLTMPGSSATWRGAFGWSSGFTTRGRLDAVAADPAAAGAVANQAIGHQATFKDARFSGVLGYQKDVGAVLSGAVSAATAGANSERFDQVHGTLGYDKSGVSLSVGQATWSGANVQAWARIDSNKNLVGAVALRNASLSRLGQKYGVRDLGGEGSAFASLAGSTQHPLVDLTSAGAGDFANQKGRFRGVFGIAASLNGDQIHLKRATWNGPDGKALAMGDLSASGGGLKVTVDAFGIDLKAANPDLSGTAAARGTIRGDLRDPQMSGRVEAYDLAFKSYNSPLAVADFNADLRKLGLTQIRVASGQGLVEGDAGYRFRDRALTGELRGESLKPGDFGLDNVAGVFDIDHLVLGGMLSNPKLSGTLKSDTLVAAGVNGKAVSAEVAYNAGVVTMTHGTADIGTGKLSGSGTYDTSSRDGYAIFDAANLPLNAVPDSLTKQVRLEGSLNAKGRVALKAGAATLDALKGSADNLEFNNVLLGSGDFEAHQEGSLVRGSAEIGSLERYLRAQDVIFDTGTKAWSFDLVTADLDLQNLYQLGQPYLTPFSDDMARKVAQVNGALSLDAQVSGSRDAEPSIDVRALDVSNLTYAGYSFGKIAAKGSKKGAVLDLTDFSWIQGASTMTLKGTADLHGDLNLNGEVSKFNFANFGIFEPKLAGLAGEATISFLATGKTEAPDVMASIDSNRVQVSTGQESSVGFSVDISSIHLTPGEKDADGKRTGQIEASGSFNYRGIGGNLAAKAPFVYPFEIPESKPLEASVTLDEQQIGVFKDLLPGLDLKRSQGSLRGAFKVDGSINALRAQGGITAVAPILNLQNGKTGLKDATASLTFTDDTLALSTMATSTSGGTLQGVVQSKIADFTDLAVAIGAGQTEDLLKSPIGGALDVTNFRFDEGSKDAGQASGALSAHIDFGGSLKRPAISGTARLLDGMVTLGGVAGTPSAIPNYAVNPTFDVDLGLDSTRVKSGSTQLSVIGGGHLYGSLQRPDLQADMTLLNGSLRLPGAKVNLEPGGTMRLAYSANGEGIPEARLDVALQGTTALTAARPGGTAQRYDITLDVRGNLLEDNGLTQTATSDPPDLSQDRIFALLGQTQIFEAFAGQTTAGVGDAQKQVRDALTGYALPIALDPITSRIANQLGLDYLTVEYNAFDLTTITFARALNRSFILQGRRQIGEPLPGRKPIADLQLFYRLPVRRGLLNRVSFSVGVDQDRPWKISAQYGSRF